MEQDRDDIQVPAEHFVTPRELLNPLRSYRAVRRFHPLYGVYEANIPVPDPATTERQ